MATSPTRGVVSAVFMICRQAAGGPPLPAGAGQAGLRDSNLNPGGPGAGDPGVSLALCNGCRPGPGPPATRRIRVVTSDFKIITMAEDEIITGTENGFNPRRNERTLSSSVSDYASDHESRTDGSDLICTSS